MQVWPNIFGEWIDLTLSWKWSQVTAPDLFVQMSVFVKFIGFPKTGYLDITAVCHDTEYRQHSGTTLQTHSANGKYS